ncbi:MAG: cytochrome C [Desulfobacteraceae bacterium]|nr:cytochrome C [Desulfobacteraceae bacterium]
MQGFEMMVKKRIQRIVMGTLAAGLVILAGSFTVMAVASKEVPEDKGGADLILIGSLKQFGALERPAVPFYHDRHTEALAGENKDCTACHQITDDKMSIKFKRKEDVTKNAGMDIYHNECIGCHAQMRKDGKKAGPETCGQCHIQDSPAAKAWQAIELDKSLHYRHVMANDKKCEFCHHEYNENSKKLFYAKGKEGACLYCHKHESEQNRVSNRIASHMACLDCHRLKSARNIDSGPLQCAGCHDPKQQALIKVIADVPRMEREQPSIVMVKNFRKDEMPSTQHDYMERAPFDHKAHEAYNQSCRICHHADLKACAECHTINGHKDGNLVKLSQAMHKKDSAISCVGCHNLRKEQTECAGCHHSIPESKTIASKNSCRTCHIKAGPDTPAAPDRTSSVAPEEEQTAAYAMEMLSGREPVRETVALDDIPEKVKIKKLADQYEPVELPHRKIVLKLVELTKDSNLAGYFHGEPMTLCQGCHHNSPASLKPPQCGSCHGRSSEALNLTRPGLMAAYHQQCIECHDQMKLEKPASRDCTACHAKRKK